MITAEWGSLEWLAGGQIGNSAATTIGRVVIKKGMSNPRHYHSCEEVLYLLRGKLVHSVGAESAELEAGDTIVLPPGVFHGAHSVGDEDAEMIVAYPTADRDFHTERIADNLIASPMCMPTLTLEELLPIFHRLGFRKLELFTRGPASGIDPSKGAGFYRALAAPYGIEFESLHLPVADPDAPGSLQRAREALGFAAEAGVQVVLIKAPTREAYAEIAPEILDRAEELGLKVVLQNHSGTQVATIDHVREVLDSVADSRLKVLLEVGHFEKVGIPWRDAFDAFRDRIAFCHIKDLRDGASTVFGRGTVDFASLFAAMGEIGYTGGYVVELEARDLANDEQRITEALSVSIEHLLGVLE
jgi:sugar phosphate isomerase/epimerase